MTRTFIALERDEALQRYLEGIIQRMAAELSGLSWVQPGGIHLTLVFLGELGVEDLRQASLAARQAAQESAPFEFRLSQPGIFGLPRQPRVLWLGIADPAGRLQHLQQTLKRELQQQGFAVDMRPFSPHLTLARGKRSLRAEEQERLQRILQVTRCDPLPYAVRRISVMKSELARTGVSYTSLQDYSLTKA